KAHTAYDPEVSRWYRNMAAQWRKLAQQHEGIESDRLMLTRGLRLERDRGAHDHKGTRVQKSPRPHAPGGRGREGRFLPGDERRGTSFRRATMSGPTRRRRNNAEAAGLFRRAAAGRPYSFSSAFGWIFCCFWGTGRASFGAGLSASRRPARAL